MKYSKSIVAAILIIVALKFASDSTAENASEQTYSISGDASQGPERLVPQVAIDAANAGNFEVALPYYRDATLLRPRDPLARSSYARVLLAAGRTRESIAVCREAVQLDANNARLRLALAIALDAADERNECISELKRAIDLAPKDHRYPIKLGIVYVQNGQLRDAIQSFDRSIAILDTIEGRIERGRALIRSGQCELALDDFNYIVERDEACKIAYALRAYANLRLARFKDAQHDAESAIEAHDEESKLLGYTVLGASGIFGGDAAADHHLSKAIELRPDSILPYVFRALARAEQTQFQSAIVDLDSAIKSAHNPQELNFWLEGCGWQVYKFRGLLRLISTNDYEGARADFSQAISLKANDADCYALRAWALNHLKLWKLTQQDLDAALKIDPQHRLAVLFKILFLTSCPDSKYRDAQGAFDLASNACKRTDGKQVEFVHGLAAAHSELGQFSEAVRLQSLVLAESRRPIATEPCYITIWWNSVLRLNLFVTESDAADVLKMYKNKMPFHERAKTSVKIANRFKKETDLFATSHN